MSVDAGVGACMLGTNAVNGTKNYNNSAVIAYLKTDLQFDGWTMTDWDGCVYGYTCTVAGGQVVV